MTKTIGVLLINLGTPDGPDTSSVRRYLGEFLSDTRVIEIPQLLWQPILRGVILRTRPKKSAHAYQQVWLPEGSPLAVYTAKIAEEMRTAFGDDVLVDWAMRYGNPDIESRMKSMLAQGCDKIVLAPLYPQYCAATTATAVDKVFAILSKLRRQPAIRTLPAYYDDLAYIEALRSSTERQLQSLSFEPDQLIASFHGMPERTRVLGDPYYEQCLETTRLLSAAMKRPILCTFQSRFGRAKWLEPATDVELKRLAQSGVQNIAVLTPGFAADCLETIEEIGLRGKADFVSFGGKNFAHISCLNASSEANILYQKLISRELAGWREDTEAS